MEELFKALVFLWAMVGLFVVAQVIIMMAGWFTRMPKVWKWRRK